MEQFFYLPSSMIWPLAACLVLTGIHVYLGVHVIARKVIFVDLALAQIAALGTVIGVLLGYEVGKDVNALYLYSLAFTIFGAFVFSATRMKGEKVPHEAIIGIVYAVTFASTILVLSKSALGPQELDHIIKGELLWVQSHVVIKTAVIYAIVGIFHFIFRKKFMAISFQVADAEASGMNVRLWDFLFYMSFGFVITSSVAIAGVFLVFSYLVIPSVGAMLLSDRLGTRLTIGWIAGSVISFLGVKISYQTGLPTSPVVVVVLAGALILAGLVRYLRHAPSMLKAVRNLGGALCIVAVFVGGVFFFRKAEEDPLEHTMHLLSSPLGTDRQSAIQNLGAYADKRSVWLATVVDRLHDPDAEVRKAAVILLTTIREQSALGSVVALLNDPSDEVQTSVIDAVKAMGDPGTGQKLVERAQTEDDPELKTNLLKTALGIGAGNAIPPLAVMLREGGIFADDAYAALHAHLPFEFTADQTPRILQWWDQNRSRIAWNPSKRIYEIH